MHYGLLKPAEPPTVGIANYSVTSLTQGYGSFFSCRPLARSLLKLQTNSSASQLEKRNGANNGPAPILTYGAATVQLVVPPRQALRGRDARQLQHESPIGMRGASVHSEILLACQELPLLAAKEHARGKLQKRCLPSLVCKPASLVEVR